MSKVIKIISGIFLALIGLGFALLGILSFGAIIPIVAGIVVFLISFFVFSDKLWAKYIVLVIYFIVALISLATTFGGAEIMLIPLVISILFFVLLLRDIRN